MNKFRVVVYCLLLAISFFLSGCEKKDFTKEPAKMHWDRDMCERCKMAISERKFAVQAVDKDNKVYKFDDIGCLILWQKLERPDVKFTKIWITHAKTGKWIDARKAYYFTNSLTPMAYGFAAYSSKDEIKDEEIIDYEEVKKRVIRIGK